MDEIQATPVEFKQLGVGEARVKLIDPRFSNLELVSTYVVTQVFFEGKYEVGLPVFRVNGQTSARIVKREDDPKKNR